MRSSAGAYNPQGRVPLWLASVPVTALVLALVIAFVSIIPHPKPRVQAPPRATVVPIVQPRVFSFPSVSPSTAQPSLLWPVLLPWAIGLDAAAVLGLILVLAVRSRARR